MKQFMVLLFMAGLLAMVGCSPIEEQARDTAAALSGSRMR